MLSRFLKNLSILKKFLFINFLVFLIIGLLTLIYLNRIQPTLIKTKTVNHINTLDNTIENLNRLQVQFNEEEVKSFLFSTRFLFQSLDRVQFFDLNFNLIGDTDTLDLDPRAFSQRLDIVEMNNLNENEQNNKPEKKEENLKKKVKILENLNIYKSSKNYGQPFTFTSDSYDQFLLTTLKNVIIDNREVGFIAVTENANDVKAVINERKVFIVRTAILVGIVIIIFSFVMNRYFLKPIKNLVIYTNLIKEKSSQETNIKSIQNRNDEIGTLSKSLGEMTDELHQRITTAENYSTDLLHEIRNPLASLKSASEIISETEDKSQRHKLVKIVSHDVERIERLITDYSQMLKDEVALSKEKIKKIDIEPIIKSVVDDFNNIYKLKRGIKISYENDNKGKYHIYGIGNRIEQIIANLLDNAISFSKDNQDVIIKVSKLNNNEVMVTILDEGQGFKENDTNKIFKRFYSNRPDKFGEHSGLGLNIVKNLVDLHSATIKASNRTDKKGASMEIIFPKV